ncbi:OprD family outer membrane porin [Seleniivibrio sp.]|uniref:OprD family outer membrane porin n=1 Tax=Seleniivibrio sp. TaxID=2898801 RepID=UPI0025CE522D|nr:OprD family outer membrane porin [Seleniivibrio sp.]MCD8553596.1 OprD family porin [Seleniivibrio sp.]
MSSKHLSGMSGRTKLLIAAVCTMFSFQAFAADNIADMFQETSVEGKLLYRFNDLKMENSTDASDSGIGGILAAKTGSLHGVSLGVTFGTANNAYSDKDDFSYGVLGDGHQSFDSMKEYYVQGELFDTTVKYGAQQISTPWVNDDIYPFMLPITYRGASLVNKSISNTEIHAYYITGISMWNESGFKDIMETANPTADSEPLLIGGIKYNLPSENLKFSAEGWTYHMENFINNNYVRTTIGTKLGEWNVYVTPSYLKQSSTGDEVGGDFDTYQYGGVAGVDAYGFNASLYYAKTGDDKIFRGWGHSAAVPAQFLVSERAEEKAMMAYAGYEFSKLGMPGVYAAVTYATFDTPDSGVNKASDASEVDWNLMYDFNDAVLKGALNGLHLEVRYAQIDYEDDPDMTELHVIASYSFAFGGKK